MSFGLLFEKSFPAAWVIFQSGKIAWGRVASHETRKWSKQVQKIKHLRIPKSMSTIAPIKSRAPTMRNGSLTPLGKRDIAPKTSMVIPTKAANMDDA